jgi:hypothetical protein
MAVAIKATMLERWEKAAVVQAASSLHREVGRGRNGAVNGGLVAVTRHLSISADGAMKKEELVMARMGVAARRRWQQAVARQNGSGEVSQGRYELQGVVRSSHLQVVARR